LSSSTTVLVADHCVSNYNESEWTPIAAECCGFLVAAILAGGKDLIVNFPQQPNWTGSVSEMECISTHSSHWSVCVCFFRYR